MNQEIRHVVHFYLNKDNPTKFKAIGTNGGTPLYTTMGNLFKRLEKDLKFADKVLVKIFTDGEDTTNNRDRWNQTSIGVYINKLINVNKWTITFNCTNQDKHHILKIGIPESNILTHNNTAEDIERVGNLRSMATSIYSKSLLAGEDVTVSFYSKSVN